MSDELTREPEMTEPGVPPEGGLPPPGRRPMASRAFRSLAVDARSLRESQPFRRLWVGQLISLVGRQITLVAVPFQVYSLTGSALDVGLLGIVQAVPLVCGSLGGGAIAARFDRRRVVIVTQLCLASCSGLLALGAFIGHPSLLAIYAVVAVAALVGAVDAPTRTAIIPNLVGVDRLAGALSLNIVLFQTTLVAGPAIGGLDAPRSLCSPRPPSTQARRVLVCFTRRQGWGR